jgi:hypothetical protein
MGHTPPALRTRSTLRASDVVEVTGRIGEPAAVPKRGPLDAHESHSAGAPRTDCTRRLRRYQTLSDPSRSHDDVRGAAGTLGGATAGRVPRSPREAT